MELNYLLGDKSPSHKNLKTKNAIYKLMKKGSPKVRDVLREVSKFYFLYLFISKTIK